MKINKKILKEVEKITSTYYGNITEDTIEVMLEDLVSMYRNQEEELKDLQRDVEENYCRKREYYE